MTLTEKMEQLAIVMIVCTRYESKFRCFDDRLPIAIQWKYTGINMFGIAALSQWSPLKIVANRAMPFRLRKSHREKKINVSAVKI